ncbi:MAG: drug/metabolite transporter (DMT)-like permease [Glaciecola sp.]|jgi:drug/metabolite transporter (DMT)-like permease
MFKNKAVTLAHISLLMVNLIYGANYTIAKGIMPDIVKPSGFIMIRVLGASALFWLVKSAFKEIPNKKDIYKFAIAGLFGVAGNQLLFFNGLNATSPLNASIIMTITPVLVILISFIVGSEKLNARRITGMVIGFLASVILIRSSVGDVSVITSWQGDVMIFLNALSYSIYLVYVRPLMKIYKPITVITWVFSFGFLFVIPFGWGEMIEVSWGTLNQKEWLTIGFVVLFTTFFTYLLNVFALKTVKSSVASTYIYLQPVIALFFSFLFYWYQVYDNVKPNITWLKVICALTIFMAVYLVSVEKKVRSST